ncbi:hypothetical protein ACWDSJ_20985 [Nocardia sp. NPDC003482]
MIAAVTDVPTDAFGIDLAEDRVVGSIDEFASATRLQRWHPSASVVA